MLGVLSEQLDEPMPSLLASAAIDEAEFNDVTGFDILGVTFNEKKRDNSICEKEPEMLLMIQEEGDQAAAEEDISIDLPTDN